MRITFLVFGIVLFSVILSAQPTIYLNHGILNSDTTLLLPTGIIEIKNAAEELLAKGEVVVLANDTVKMSIDLLNPSVKIISPQTSTNHTEKVYFKISKSDFKSFGIQLETEDDQLSEITITLTSSKPVEVYDFFLVPAFRHFFYRKQKIKIGYGV